LQESEFLRRLGGDAEESARRGVSNLPEPSIMFLIVAIGMKRSHAAVASDFAGFLCQMLLFFSAHRIAA
jgi:hypothetical protein